MERNYTVIGIAFVLVTSIIGGGVFLGSPSSGDATNAVQAEASEMNVENVEVVNRSNGIITAKVTVSGEMNESQLKQALSRMYDDRKVAVRSIRIENISGNVATVSLVTRGHSNSETVETQIQDQLTNQSAENQSTPQANNSSDSDETIDRDPNATHYQIDFVKGEPIENLRGPNGTYTNDQLIRFAHGSNETPLYRSSDGEFTTNETLARCVESTPISVDAENDTATVAVSLAEGCGPVELSLVSYTKPEPVWSPETEHLQEFVDADTQTIRPNESQNLTVDLPTNTSTSSVGASDPSTTTGKSEATTEGAETETTTATEAETNTERATESPTTTETTEAEGEGTATPTENTAETGTATTTSTAAGMSQSTSTTSIQTSAETATPTDTPTSTVRV
ncbi:hypothetical protein [Halococcus thailandensis]|uniref:Uncharacterized protein n=1 Tax=Halococcus thailandensis JCM 13552 TaxID=1227457 RepID=M0MX10_9EURY|nr:hypothetical protein [Halococcus thailandensis]EMA48960.1 hypothetical protein C451_19578 [Halococcus thailandensis JCM 13552]